MKMLCKSDLLHCNAVMVVIKNCKRGEVRSGREDGRQVLPSLP